MPDVNYILLHFLKLHHKGKDKAITIKHIIGELRLWDLKLTDPDVRVALRRLNHEGYPVCTCSKGVYYGTEPEDLDRYMANLGSRVTKILERMRDVNRIKAREFIKGQMNLFG